VFGPNWTCTGHNIWQSVAQYRSKKEKQSDFKHVVAATLVLS